MSTNIVNLRNVCPRCSERIIVDTVTAEILCSKCGFVIDSYAENSKSDAKIFSMEDYDKKNHSGNPITLSRHDMGLSTVINTRDVDSTGKSLSPSMKRNFERLRTYDTRSKTNAKASASLKKAFAELEKIREKLSLSDAIIERSAYLYRKAHEHRLGMGRSIIAMTAATTYLACRDLQNPRTIRDFEVACNTRRKDIVKAYMAIVKKLNLQVPVVSSIQCVSRISSSIDVSEKVKRFAVKILAAAEKNEISSGRDPMGLASSALYLACKKYNLPHTQKYISSKSGITEVTLRNSCNALKKLEMIMGMMMIERDER